MVRAYGRPPLIEAICNFRFSNSHSWDCTIPGLLYEHVKDDLPTKEQMNVIETIIDPNQVKIVQQVQPKIQFLSKDRTSVIQVAPDNLSIHQLRPYNGWYTFKSHILKYLHIYHKTANASDLIHIGLRYLNRLEIAHPTIELEDYFRIIPRIPDPIPQIFPSFLFNIDIPYDTPSSGLKLTFGTVVPDTPNCLAYLLDLEMFTISDAIPSLSSIPDWLETAHHRLQVAFDSAFTDQTHHEIFEEVSHEPS